MKQQVDITLEEEKNLKHLKFAEKGLKTAIFAFKIGWIGLEIKLYTILTF